MMDVSSSTNVLVKEPIKVYENRWSNQLGTHVISKYQLSPPTELWCESAYASVVLEESHTLVCHYCWKSFRASHHTHFLDNINSSQKNDSLQNSDPFQEGDNIDPVICSYCQWSMYCSEICQSNDAFEHNLLCPVWGNTVSGIAQKNAVTVNRVRLMMKCLVRKYIEDEEQQQQADSGNNNVNSTTQWKFSDVLNSMTTNEDQLGAEWIDCLKLAAQDILTVVSPEIRLLTVMELVKFLCISDTNSFGIAVEYPQTEVPTKIDLRHIIGHEPEQFLRRPQIVAFFIAGLGLYLQCAKLNHSCYPSCQFSLRYGSRAPLSMKLLRCVGKNEELTDSYVDLYTDRTSRRAELLRTKHFLCHCQRCEQPLEQSADRYLSGYICVVCQEQRKKISVDSSNHLTWNTLILEAGGCLVKGIPLPRNLVISINQMIQDFSNLDPFWYRFTPDSLEKTSDVKCRSFGLDTGDSNCSTKLTSSKNENRATRHCENTSNGDAHGINVSLFQDPYSMASREFETFYNPSTIPVLLPPTLDQKLGLEMNDTLDELFLEAGHIPNHLNNGIYRCEKCKTEVEADSLAPQIKKAELLQARIVEEFQFVSFEPNATVEHARKIRRQLGLFFQLFCGDLYHPFHNWIYRASQRLVDTTREILLLNPSAATLTRDEIDLLLLDILFIRHQIACQSVVFPAYHEERFLTLRVIAYIFHQLLYFCEDLPECIDRNAVMRAFDHCSQLLEDSKRVLYTDVTNQ